MAKEKGFWGKFEELMSSLPGHIDEEIQKIERSVESGDNSISTVGSNNVVISGNSFIEQTSRFNSSSSTIVQGGKKIVITTKNGKITITVNGKEYVPKEKSSGKD